MTVFARPPKLWRIRGTAPGGQVVTLGRYETEPEAQVDMERLSKEGRYRELDLQAIDPPPPPPIPPGRPV